MSNKSVHNYFVMDFETGGLNPEKNAITEMGYIFLDGLSLEEIGRGNDYFKHNYDPSKSYEQKALEYTGIQITTLEREGVDPKKVVNDLIKQLKQHKVGRYKKPIIVGHNVTFDVGFLKVLFEWAGHNVYDYVELYVEDTMQLFRSTNFIAKNTLTDCCLYLGMGMFDAHRAIADVEATVEVFKYFMAKRRGEAVSTAKESSTTVGFDRNSFKFEF